jgi:hypothetical protein
MVNFDMLDEGLYLRGALNLDSKCDTPKRSYVRSHVLLHFSLLEQTHCKS